MVVTEGPQLWPFFTMCDLTALTPAISSTQQQMAQDMAVEWLWSNTGRQFGTRATTYRPQSRGRGAPGWPMLGLQPVDSSIYAYYNGALGGSGDSDWTVEHDQVLELPGPVVSVESVYIAGVLLDPSTYRLDGNYLVRQDGGFWPRTQNMIAPVGSADTWIVDYTRGRAPSSFGQYATGLLICYFGKQLSQGKPCQLPWNTTAVSRAGVSIQRDASKMTSPVPEVDMWVSMVNPSGLREQPKVWSPDVDRNRWPYAGSYQVTAAPQGMSVGDITQLADFLVLGPTAPVPPGTPPGTVIFRTE